MRLSASQGLGVSSARAIPGVLRQAHARPADDATNMRPRRVLFIVGAVLSPLRLFISWPGSRPETSFQVVSKPASKPVSSPTRPFEKPAPAACVRMCATECCQTRNDPEPEAKGATSIGNVPDHCLYLSSIQRRRIRALLLPASKNQTLLITFSSPRAAPRPFPARRDPCRHRPGRERRSGCRAPGLRRAAPRSRHRRQRAPAVRPSGQAAP